MTLDSRASEDGNIEAVLVGAVAQRIMIVHNNFQTPSPICACVLWCVCVCVILKPICIAYFANENDRCTRQIYNDLHG